MSRALPVHQTGDETAACDLVGRRAQRQILQPSPPGPTDDHEGRLPALGDGEDRAHGVVYGDLVAHVRGPGRAQVLGQSLLRAVTSSVRETVGRF